MWMQRLGAFFQEMRANPPAGGVWAPSPFPSPPTTRRHRALHGLQDGRRGEQGLFTPDQWHRIQQMENQAPLLYGQGQARDGQGDVSSNDSTREAVEAEVRRQMQGLVAQLEASRKEAGELREEVERMRQFAQGGQEEARLQAPTASGLQAPLQAPTASGFQAPLQAPSASGLQASLQAPTASGFPATLQAPTASGLQAPLQAPTASGLQASRQVPTASGFSAARQAPSATGGASLRFSTATGGERCSTTALPTTMDLHQEAGGVALSFEPGVVEMPDVSRPPEVPRPMRENSEVGPSPLGPPRTYGPARSPATTTQGGEERPLLQARNTPPRTPLLGPAEDPMTRLLQGLERVIGAKSDKPEEVSKASIEAPQLPEAGESASVDFGDWMHCLEHVMGDISTSSEWWGMVKDAATRYYEQYQAADQFARLTLKPTFTSEIKQQRWDRVDRRAAGMILQAIPGDIRKELVASRARSTLEIMCRLMVIYRPGSMAEKSQLLRKIENPDAATNAVEAVDGLRLWLRIYTRAQDLSLVVPDPSVMLKALDTMVRKPLSESQEITFRMQLLRYHLKIDINPSAEGVLAIHRAYLAEFEQIASRRSSPKGSGQPRGQEGQQTGQGARIKAVDSNKGEGPKAGKEGATSPQRPCKFFLTDEGCRRGKACKFEHSMDKDKRERCWVCGSKQHTSRTCPTKQPKEDTNKGASPKAAAMAQTRKQAELPATEAGTSAKVENVDATSSISTTAPATSTASVASSEDPVQGVPVERLLEDAQRLMKALVEGQQKGVSLRAFQIPGTQWDELPPLRFGVGPETIMKNLDVSQPSRMGLIDSGATHPLRPAASSSELQRSIAAEVILAGDKKISLPQTPSGVILGDNEAQPIVPLGSLVKSLGYEFVWNSRGCRLRHPTRPEVQVYTRSTCPEVRECDALRLISELETKSLKAAMVSLEDLKATVAAVKAKEEGTWRDFLKKYLQTGQKGNGLQAICEAPFMAGVPAKYKVKILEAIPQNDKEAWDLMRKLPLNRSRRRSLWRGRNWIVHLFSGKKANNDPIRKISQEVVEVDLEHGWDIKDSDTYALLLWAAAKGKVEAVIGGPPCRTFSLLRHRPSNILGERGPKPVRAPHELWGKFDLDAAEQTLVDGDNILILRMVWLWLVADEGRKEIMHEEWQTSATAFGLEHPEDPREFLKEGDELWEMCVSLWRTGLVRMLGEECELRAFHFDQGAYGHQQTKPTVFLSNMSLNLEARDQRPHTPQPKRSSEMAAWAPGFRSEIVHGLERWKRTQLKIKGEIVEKKMSPQELAKWKDHIDAGHWPYRRDCSTCLASAGTGRPARKVVHRDGFVLSVDISGPFRNKGVDEKKGRRYRYCLAATYLFPRGGGQGQASKDEVVCGANGREGQPDQEGVQHDQENPEDKMAPLIERPHGAGPIDSEEEEDFFEQDEEPDGEGPAGDLVVDAEAEQGEDEWKKLVEDLKKPLVMDALKFVIPLEKHRGRDILEAIQDIYITLRTMGMPLLRIHSDRASEFRTKMLRKWARERDVFQTYSEGVAPAQNGSAEGHVKWLKKRARTLLVEGYLDKKYWPCAMKMACRLHNDEVLGKKPAKTRFGSVVWIKSKKDHGPFDPRWEKGVFLGPADDVREGQVVQLDDGMWIRTLHMRQVREDEQEEVKPEYVVDYVDPVRRVRGKTKLPDPEARKMSVYEELRREDIVKKLLQSPLWSAKEAKAKRPQLMKDRDEQDTDDEEGRAYVTLGAYQHGGIVNLTNATHKFEEEAMLVAELIKRDHPLCTFTSVTLVKNSMMPIHRDNFNKKDSLNLISPLSVTKGSMIWQEMQPGDEFGGRYESRIVREREVPGQLFSVERPAQVMPKRLHQPVPGEPGDRILAVAYTIARDAQLDQGVRDQLHSLGFVLPRLKTEIVDAKVGPEEEQEATPMSISRRSSPSGQMGGARTDCMVVPGGKVRLDLKWDMSYQPEGPEPHEERLSVGEREDMQDRVVALRRLLAEEQQLADEQSEDVAVDLKYSERLMDAEEELDFLQETLERDARREIKEGVSALWGHGKRIAKIAASDVTTENVEGLLQNLKGALTVTHTVSLAEVKQNIKKWKPSIAKEINHLEGNGTLVPIPLAQARDMSSRGEVVLVPAKTVHTVKPPDPEMLCDQPKEEPLMKSADDEAKICKRKTRLVICGNYIKGDVDVFTTAASAESLRCGLAVAAKRRWSAAITDINSAFTLTPMTESSVRYAITIPRVVVDADCAQPDTAYLVERVLYGLREAPRLWGNFRDRRIKGAKITIEGIVYKFVQMETDNAVWRLVGERNEQETIGMMIVYVDDVMFLGEDYAIKAMYHWITKGEGEEPGWKCSELEWVTSERPARYLGMEVRCRREGRYVFYHISQAGYIADLIREYAMENERPSMVPATKDYMPTYEDQDACGDEEQVRLAQKCAGELLWLSTRTRPDIGFATNHVCAAAARDPEGAQKLARLVRRYLATTPSMGLSYYGLADPVVAFSDASFAPSGDKSFGCSAAALYGGFVAWRMTRQPLITLSVAEAELYELVAAHQLALGIQTWMEEIEPGIVPIVKADNMAAVGLATTAPGSWKTRHLRVRARYIRQEISQGTLLVAHTPGEEQPADLGTKPIPAPRLQILRGLWHMKTVEEFLGEGETEVVVDGAKPSAEMASKVMALCVVCSMMQGARASETKGAMELDYSVEFYVVMAVCVAAMLGVWEFGKWALGHLCCSRDEVAVQRARRLLRIRDQTARALQQELANMTENPQGPARGEDQATTTTSAGTMTTQTPPEPAEHPHQLQQEDVPAAEALRNNYTFRCLPKTFVMSEHGDRVHVTNECYGLRNANKARLRHLQYCVCCAGRYPLYYRTPFGDPPLG